MHLHQYITIELENSILYRCLHTCGWERIVETDNSGNISYSAWYRWSYWSVWSYRHRI